MRSRVSALLPQLARYINFLDQYNLLSSTEAHRLQDPRFERSFARTILAAHKGSARKPRLAGYEFSIVTFRSLTGKSFASIVVTDRRLKFQRKLTVFVGHRFVRGVSNNLRHNLQCVLRPYGIQLQYSDSDMPNRPVFQTVLDRINISDFCVFDDRETEIRPNVFIELGAAIAMLRPYFYFSFQNKRTVKVNRKNEKIDTPSDLAGMLYLTYSNYENLFMEFAMRLPGFLLDRKLAKR